MTKDRYNLRTEDHLQDIMQKPPHAFILKGNFLIVLVLTILVFLLDRFPIHEKKSFPCQIIKVQRPNNRNKQVVIQLSMDMCIDSLFIGGIRNPAYFIIKNSNNKIETIYGKITNITYSKYGMPFLTFEGIYINNTSINSGMIGSINIQTKSKSFISMFKQQFKLSSKIY
ncbi:hypothetical protein [Rhizosphaericola mali]|uniref:Uncharacterized protein n=1 Tax=Rhizosphaericola mali TaxID=2545455 RepID=A0A5P2GAW6_9BACT|nr:hypothetical protein [Rhizosphaericola mali]QES91062.1 hypothetical protein E0W69_020325 [Rhizosphaericola mali]